MVAVCVALNGKQKRFLRSLGHSLKPVLQVGHAGVTDGLLAELSRALELHELIKIKVGGECPEPVGRTAATLASASTSEVAQVLGRTVLLYRRRAKDPQIELPAGGAAAG